MQFGVQILHLMLQKKEIHTEAEEIGEKKEFWPQIGEQSLEVVHR